MRGLHWGTKTKGIDNLQLHGLTGKDNGTSWMPRSGRSMTSLNYFIVVAALCILIFIASFTSVLAAEKWAGVDETVVGKVAKEHGMETREPLIETDKGDLLLFVFLIAGTVGGFAAGYYWRVLTERRVQNIENEQERGIDK